jgi:hypothetical protein
MNCSEYNKLAQECPSTVIAPVGENPFGFDVAYPEKEVKETFDMVQVEKEVTINNIKKFSIVSKDGLSDKTEIFYDGIKVEGVTNLTINIDAETGLAMLNMSVLAPLFNIELPVNHVTITKAEISDTIEKIFNNLYKNDDPALSKKDIDQNNAT